jgi:hypothetical protein
MSEQDVRDGLATFDRIGRACDVLRELGYPEVGNAIAEATRARRGRVRAHVCPRKLAEDLLELEREVNRLVRVLSPVPLLCRHRAPSGVLCEFPDGHDGPHDWEPRKEIAVFRDEFAPFDGPTPRIARLDFDDLPPAVDRG